MGNGSDYNEVIENLKSLSIEELEAAKESLRTEFGTLHEEFTNNKTRETATRLVEMGNASEAIDEELQARKNEESELTLAAEAAAEKVIKKEIDQDRGNEEKSTPNGDEDAPGEDVPTKSKEEERKEVGDVSFSSKDPEEDVEETEVDVVVDPAETSEEIEVDVVAEETPSSEDDEDEDSFSNEDASDEEVPAEDNSEATNEPSDEDELAQEDSEGGDSNENEDQDEESDETESDSDMSEIKDFSAPSENAPEAKGAEVEKKVVTITAGADIKGYAAGSEMPNIKSVAQAVLERSRTMNRAGSGNDGDYSLVASLSYKDFYGENNTLNSFDTEGNREKVEAVVAALHSASSEDPQAVVAAGGLYGPVETVYDIYEMGETTDRPVKAALPSFQADRGGIRFMTPPVMADLDGAVSVWTLEDDIAAKNDGGPTKPCIRVKAGAEITVYLEAMPLCLTFGNLGARAWPELVERHIALAMALQARFAETRLLTRIGALSTQVTTEAELGAARDILVHLEVATTGMRSRHRLDPKAPLKALFPVWFRNALRADLVKQLPGDGQDTAFNLVDATIDKWFAARNVTPVWFLDGEAGQIFGAQVDGPLNEFPDSMIWYLFPEGTFLHLDGGTLDLGLVRDSVLNSTNDYKIFLETFENVAKVGVESLRITTPVRIAGASASTVPTIAGAEAVDTTPTV